MSSPPFPKNHNHINGAENLGIKQNAIYTSLKEFLKSVLSDFEGMSIVF